jgi:hypothetical protein
MTYNNNYESEKIGSGVCDFRLNNFIILGPKVVGVETFLRLLLCARTLVDNTI